MTSIHDDLALISQIDGWGALTWHPGAPAVGDLHRAPLRHRRRPLRRLVSLALGWRERARARHASQGRT
jgi:hypothetical protein